MKKLLLDTNAYSALLRNDKKVIQHLRTADQLNFSVFVYAELLFGFKSGSKLTWNHSILRKFLAQPNVLFQNATEETAVIFTEIKQQLKIKGQPIPTHDIWIASQAIELGSVLATYDQHFKHISGLRLWD